MNLPIEPRSDWTENKELKQESKTLKLDRSVCS